MNARPLSELQPADSKSAFQAMCKSPPSWMITSMADAQQLAASEHSPWKGVPKEALAEFIGSLEFKRGGLAHSRYSSLEPHMDVRAFLSMWSYFGIGRQLFIEEADKKCESPGTCAYCNGCSCTSNC